jgi:hypothetical protein
LKINKSADYLTFVKIQLSAMDQAVTRDSFRFQLDKVRLNEAERRDGYYLMRSNLTDEDPAVLWARYVQLTQIEAVFRCLKSELGIRPIHHQKEHRIDAHIFVAFLAYCLQVTLKNRLTAYAPGLTPLAVLEKLGTIQMIDVCIPTSDGRWLIMPRYTQPDDDLKLLLHHLHLELDLRMRSRWRPVSLPGCERRLRRIRRRIVDGRDCLENPALLVEVLSPDSADFDRGTNSNNTSQSRIRRIPPHFPRPAAPSAAHRNRSRDV